MLRPERLEQMVSDDTRSSTERGDLQQHQPQMLRNSSHLTKSFQCLEISASSVLLWPPLIHELGALCDLKDNFGLTEFLFCMWLTEVPGITLLPPCIWTSSHKDSKQPRQSFNHRYTLTETLSKSHVWWRLKGGEEELQDINIYMYMSGLLRFLSLNQVCLSMRQYSVLRDLFYYPIYIQFCMPTCLVLADRRRSCIFVRDQSN